MVAEQSGALRRSGVRRVKVVDDGAAEGEAGGAALDEARLRRVARLEQRGLRLEDARLGISEGVAPRLQWPASVSRALSRRGSAADVVPPPDAVDAGVGGAGESARRRRRRP